MADKVSDTEPRAFTEKSRTLEIPGFPGILGHFPEFPGSMGRDPGKIPGFPGILGF